jgi:hypothetical protein
MCLSVVLALPQSVNQGAAGTSSTSSGDVSSSPSPPRLVRSASHAYMFKAVVIGPQGSVLSQPHPLACVFRLPSS